MRQPPILMYHWFRDAERESLSRSPQLEIDPGLFARQMEFLARSGYRPVTVSELLDTEGDDPRAGKRIAVTFDDGTLDFWDFARPVLQRYGFRATLYVVTGSVGARSDWDHALGEPARPLMSWDQLEELAQAGFEIGSHTHRHRVLVDLDEREALDELTRSREMLGEKLGTLPRSLAYPRGFFDQRHKRLAAQAGYDSACAVVLALRDLLHSDRYELRRMTIKGTESFSRFRMRLALSGLIPYRSS